MRLMVSLKVVAIRVQFDHDAIRKSYNGVDDTKEDFTNGIVDEGGVGHVSCAGEIELQFWWVDECHLCGTD